MTGEALSAKLRSIAAQAEVTGVPWRSLSRFYTLPSDVQGLRILDVCAGMSDLAYQLRQQGAVAYALDIAYADLAGMRSRYRANFEATAQDVFGAAPGSEKAEALYASFVQGFEESLTSMPSVYVAGSATSLPFRSDSFDLVVSFNGLFGALDFDLGVLVVALKEAVRVLKLGGGAQLVPFQEGPVLNEAEKDIQRAAVKALAEDGRLRIEADVARDEPLLAGRVGRLTITKAHQ